MLLLAMAPLARAQQWIAPTDEELKMTEQPEVPGTAAVCLFKEEISEDSLHAWSNYVRLKVLTDKGKEYANVELGQYYNRNTGGFTISDIQGRTIHPDGTIIPFTGKPYEKTIEKGQGVQQTAKVFTLPDVTVGSILEYRYKLRYDERSYMIPTWYVQTGLYTRKAHYLWRPIGLVPSWSSILPKDAVVTKTKIPSVSGGSVNLELVVHDVAPVPVESFMPPVLSQSYRVLFYYAAIHAPDEFWKQEGLIWAKAMDKFIGPDSKMKDVAASLVAPGDSDDQKLRKIYAAVMTLENTNFTRKHSEAENKAEGFDEIKNVDDIWNRKRGNDRQITDLFIALARASGMKAYAMLVPARDRSMFLPDFLSFTQLDDFIAVVNVDGKEQYFDPGQRDCPYGYLAWKHTLVQGLRQTDSGAVIASVLGEPMSSSRTQRVAQLTIDEHGAATGTVRMQWTGGGALPWRQINLMGDATSLNHLLQTMLERSLPAGMEVQVGKIENLEDYEKPLIVNYNVKGQIGSSTGKRIVVPSDIFEVNAKPTFTQAKREQDIFFEYAHAVQDITRISFPEGLGVETSPATEQIPLANVALYKMNTDSTPTSITVHREFDLAKTYFKLAEYPDLRTFYNKYETKDQEPVILKAAAQSASSN